MVSIKGVGVLHRELSNPNQAGSRTSIIAPLGLNLVNQLRHLLVAVDLKASDIGNDLFVGHRKDHIPTDSVVEAAHLAIDRVEAAGLFPDVSRVHHWHEDLLAPDRIDLFADDLFDLLNRTVAQGEKGKDARP